MWTRLASAGGSRALQLPPDHCDLAPDRALVGRLVIMARLKPVQHFTDKLALRFGEAVVMDSPRDRYEEGVPVVTRRGARARCASANWLTRLFAAERSMFSLELLDLRAYDQDVGGTYRDPLGWLADPLPLRFALRLHPPDMNLLQSRGFRPEERKHVSAGD